jgi:hypothetical protein
MMHRSIPRYCLQHSIAAMFSDDFSLWQLKIMEMEIYTMLHEEIGTREQVNTLLQTINGVRKNEDTAWQGSSVGLPVRKSRGTGVARTSSGSGGAAVKGADHHSLARALIHMHDVHPQREPSAEGMQQSTESSEPEFSKATSCQLPLRDVSDTEFSIAGSAEYSERAQHARVNTREYADRAETLHAKQWKGGFGAGGEARETVDDYDGNLKKVICSMSEQMNSMMLQLGCLTSKLDRQASCSLTKTSVLAALVLC